MTDQKGLPIQISPEAEKLAWLGRSIQELNQGLHNLRAVLEAHGSRINQQETAHLDLVDKVAKALADQQYQGRLLGVLEAMVTTKHDPSITVRHYQAPDGSWLYETSVTIRPEDEHSLPNTLAYVDQVAQQEARNRGNTTTGQS